MSIIKILSLILLIMAGACMFVYGGYDDSPGAQLLGLLMSGAGIFGMVRGRKRDNMRPKK